MNLIISKVETKEDFKELYSFFDSLTTEFNTNKLTKQQLKEAEILMIMKVNNKIVGLSGILKLYKFIPFFFIIISNNNQRKGYGKLLLEEVHNELYENHFFSTIKIRKSNLRSIKVHESAKYRRFFSICKNNYYIRWRVE